MVMQKTIANLIRNYDEAANLSDWYGMSLEQILTAIDYAEYRVFWGCWSQIELSTVFYAEGIRHGI